MTGLWTEKETEAWLEFETRAIPLPEGGREMVSGTKLLWSAVDYIIRTHTYTMPELIGFTRKTMASKGYSFDDSFKAVVARIDQILSGRS
jgi:hypothetical protein